MEKIKTMIVDDMSEYRTALKMILGKIDQLEIVGEASNGLSFLEKLEELNPDLVFMDIEMPVMNGIEATKQATLKNRDLIIIALSFHHQFQFVKNMLEAGAVNFIEKANINKKMIEEFIKNKIILKKAELL